MSTDSNPSPKVDLLTSSPTGPYEKRWGLDVYGGVVPGDAPWTEEFDRIQELPLRGLAMLFLGTMLTLIQAACEACGHRLLATPSNYIAMATLAYLALFLALYLRRVPVAVSR